MKFNENKKSLFLALKDRTHSIFSDSRFLPLFLLFIAFLLLSIFSTILYEKIPLIFSYSLWGEESFYSGIIVNMYSSAIDFFFFSIGLYFLMVNYEKREQIKKYRNNIDDTRFWFSAEAAFKNYANIRRLQELGVNSIDFSKCYLENTKPKGLKLNNSSAMGAILNSCNFEDSCFFETSFRGAFAKKASFYKTKIIKCEMSYLKFNDGNMKSSYLEDVTLIKAELDGANFHSARFNRCNFKNASIADCNMERADLRGAINLTVAQLLKCKSLKYAKIDESLEKEIRQINPKLFA